MPQFQYQALTRESRPTGGVISASSSAHAISRLAQGGSFVTEIHEATGHGAASAAAGPANVLGPRHVRLKGGAKVALFRQLAVALQAGLNLLAALKVVHEQADSAAMRDLVAEVIGRVEGGDALSQAMGERAGTFSALEVAMVRVGETAGVLEQIMASLAEFAQRDLEIREKLRSASMYPLTVMLLGLVSVVVIVAVIVPRIMVVVQQTGQSLPLPTRILVGVSDAVRSPVGVVAAVALLAGAAWGWTLLKRPEGRLALDQLKLRLPILGHAIRRAAVARFARTLGTLAHAGVPIVEAMRIIRNTLGNEALAREVDRATTGIVQGKSIAEPLRETGQFPPLLIQVIAMGERTGRLDELLINIADAYDRETQAALQRVMTLVPVLIILVLALVVGFVLAAALLPVFTMDLSAGM